MHEKAQKELNRVGKTLDASSFSGAVQVIHQDGSMMLFNYAFLVDFDRWWLVFTEHCGHHAFYKDDIERVCSWCN